MTDENDSIDKFVDVIITRMGNGAYHLVWFFVILGILAVLGALFTVPFGLYKPKKGIEDFLYCAFCGIIGLIIFFTTLYVIGYAAEKISKWLDQE